MAYDVQNFEDGQVLYAENLNKIERYITDNETEKDNIVAALNNKLEEAGVEERGRTIEEAVDLLPAMGGSGGLQLEKIGETKTLPWLNNQGQIMIEYYKLGDNIGIVRGGGGGMPYTAPSDIMEIEIDTTPFRRIVDVNMAHMLLPVLFANNNKPLRTTGLMMIDQVSGEMSLVGLPTEPFNSFEVCGMIPAKTVIT